MQRIILTISICLATIVPSFAKEMKVKYMEMCPMELIAGPNIRRDLNGELCALVKVPMPEGAVFEGNVIGTVENRAGEYWVYLSPGTKHLMVKHKEVLPLFVQFADYDVAPLRPNTTYRLMIDFPEVNSSQTVTVNYSPEESMVVVDGLVIDGVNGVASTVLPSGKDYSYTVSARGYIAQQGSFHLNSAAPLTLHIHLSEAPATENAPAQEAALPSGNTGNTLAEADKAYDDGYYNRALELYRKISDNPEAQNKIGVMYYLGEGVKQDYEEALSWWLKAARQGHARAQCSLGICYSLGHGIDKDSSEAVIWYRKAAEQGMAQAQNQLGTCYFDGTGVPQDYSKALLWYHRAAEQGEEYAEYNLGSCYYNGIGVEQDDVEAAKWFRKAAEKGHPGAQCDLGYCYEAGRGVPEDIEEAVKWYRKGADGGNLQAQINLGNCYLYGNGIDKDEYQGISWLRKAAEKGSPRAQYYLGECFETGTGVLEDPVEAVRWYRKAAEQNHAEAQYRLGVCYEHGSGVMKDAEQARKWYLKAQENGYIIDSGVSVGIDS